MNENGPLVSIVDDDESVRESLPDLLRELGYRVEAFSSAESFLASGSEIRTHCLILDVAMPGMTGPELLRNLYNNGEKIPVIFITAHRDENVRRRLMADGAVACLYKPFSDAALQMALAKAIPSV
ncbi:MAG: response regulator [Mesorhizobium sp.]|nr:MAG: response regulator [Mesorhizobium sp.]TIU42178.1 MAG: response regulator [Mesorhizobium sp.]